MDISPVLVWFLLGVALFVTELAVPGFILFFLGIGAWCAASVLAVLDISLSAQLIIFLISSLATLVVLRSWLRSIFLGDSIHEDEDSVNRDKASLTGVVTDTITPPGYGRVKYGGSFWRAFAEEPIAENTVVLIVEKKDLFIKVRTFDAAKEE